MRGVTRGKTGRKLPPRSFTGSDTAGCRLATQPGRRGRWRKVSVLRLVPTARYVLGGLEMAARQVGSSVSETGPATRMIPNTACKIRLLVSFSESKQGKQELHAGDRVAAGRPTAGPTQLIAIQDCAATQRNSAGVQIYCSQYQNDLPWEYETWEPRTRIPRPEPPARPRVCIFAFVF